MKYILKNINYEPFDLDDEMVTFYFDIYSADTNQFLVKYFLSFDELLQFISIKHKDFFNYWEATRKSTGLWGQAETTTLATIGTEANKQIFAFLEEYMAQNEKIIDNEVDKTQELISDVSFQKEIYHKELELLFEDLKASAATINEANKKYRKFCQTLEKKAREIALEIYPEIADLNPDQLRQFEHLFVNEIISMQSKIEELIKSYK